MMTMEMRMRKAREEGVMGVGRWGPASPLPLSPSPPPLLIKLPSGRDCQGNTQTHHVITQLVE